VAKYSAEIEILVRGGKQLEAVISQVQILSAAIGKLNNTALKPADSAIRNSISGIDVYTKSLRQAEQAEKQLTRAIELRQKQLRVPSPAVPSRSGSGGGGGGGRAGGGVGKAIGGSLSSAAIGGAFPLLFGQSPQAAVGGAIGGLLGGAGGGFAGSLLGTALGELEAAKARTKELTLELGLSSTQAKTLATAFELAGRNSQQLEAAVTNIQGLGLSTKETASAIKIAVELSKEYGGSVEKIAQSFADTLESGKVSITTLNKFTAQGIPIQDELAKKFGVSRTKLLEMAKDGEISVQQLTDALVEMGREAEATADKGETGFDRFTRAVKDISTAIASAAGALLKILIPALDAVLTKLSAVINRATQAINLVTDAQVGSAESALFKVGMSQGMFGGFAQSKGNIDLLTDGLKTLKPQLATNQEELNKFAGTLQSYRTKLRQFGGETGEYAVKTAQVELSRVERDIAARATALKVDTQVPATAQITDITAPANLPPSGAATQKSTDRSKQIFEGILRLQNQIRQAYLDQAKAALQATEFSQGEAAAIELQLSKFEEIAKVRVQILDTERSLELTSAESGEQAALINKLYATKLDILAAQDALEKQQLKRKISEIAVEKELAAVQRQRDISAAKRDIRRQTFSTQLDIAAFTTSSKEIEQQRLALEQNFRWTDATREANEKIRDLKYELSNQDLDTASRDTAQLDMEAQQAKLAVIEKELSLLDQVEQKQLRLQQFFATYGQLIQSVSGEIAGAITFGVSEMIRGTKTAEEVFAQFLNSVGDALLSTAQQMIASYIAIGIAKMFAGLGGGGADPAAAGGDWISAVGRLSPNAKGNAFGANGIAPFARGGAFTSSARPPCSSLPMVAPHAPA
jgi:tape measure domain-containing protein